MLLSVMSRPKKVNVELVMYTVANFCLADKVFLWVVKNEASEQNIKYH